MSTTIGTVPPLRRAAALLVGVESGALVAVAVWIGVRARMGEDATAMSAAIAVMALVAGIPLALASRALWAGAVWPRGLALTWQVLQAAAGVTVIEWSGIAGIVTIAIAIAAAAALFVDARRDLSRAGSEAGSDPQPPAA